VPNLNLYKKRVLITGANGLLGQKLVKTLLNDFEIYGIGNKKQPSLSLQNYRYEPCDISKRDKVRELVKSFEPHVIVNAAAFTDVDGSEDNKELCWRVNVIGVENLVYAARKVNAFMVHVSTDYVFDGSADIYHEDSKPSPLGFYGRAKLAGENALIASDLRWAIARTMVLYGTGINLGSNFAMWLIEKLSKNEAVTVVDDQFGHPTLADDLARAIRKIIELGSTGIFNVVGSEYINRYDFALKLADVFDYDKKLIRPIKTEDLQQKAPRPLKSRFALDKVEKELEIQMSNTEAGLRILKQQLAGDQ